jgi:hypothetical protein
MPIDITNIGKATYPESHAIGMIVPKGGASCLNCAFLAYNKKDCASAHFIQWNNGDTRIPLPPDQYVSDWWEPIKKDMEAATEVSHEGDQKGSLWNGIKITGFTGPEEEGLRAMLSRVPPELLFAVKAIKSAKELNAKHGRYIPDTNTVLFNPDNFASRQRLGKGYGSLSHPELTVVHEIGHSLYMSLAPEKQQEWIKLSGWMEGSKPGQSPAYEECRPGWEPGKSDWTHKAGVLYPRWYSEKDPNEAFADCFAYYILGKSHQMSPAIKDFLESFVNDNVKRYPQTSIQSPEK